MGSMFYSRFDLKRREFLELASLLFGQTIMPNLNAPPEKHTVKPGAKNVIIVVFDALSAAHLPIYGYSRDTAPNLSRFAKTATVYHNHYAGGNFTTPGTASLLTGTYPFTHRAFRINDIVADDFAQKNFFSEFNDHHRVAYSHNGFVNTLLNQFESSINQLKPQKELFLNSDLYLNNLFAQDDDIAQVSWNRIIKEETGDYSNSLYLSDLFKKMNELIVTRFRSQFPRGLPNISAGQFFILEHVIEWMSSHLYTLPQPFLGYFHLMPPHYPYNTSQQYVDNFLNDDYYPEKKIRHRFSKEYSQSELNTYRRYYDEFILYADAQFGHLMRSIIDFGLANNTWVIFTSDHGELFERGIWKHITRVLFENIVRIPLLIWGPGQQTREDIYTPTSAIDVLPTMLYLNKKPVPDWCEGKILPPYQPYPLTSEKSIYAVEAKQNKKNEPLIISSTMLLKWPFKLVEYKGYKDLSKNLRVYDLHNLETDPEEQINLYNRANTTARIMVEELRDTIQKADEPYTT